MAFTWLRSGICVANLHASRGPRPPPRTRSAPPPRRRSGGPHGRPLILGGDFNLRPAPSRDVFADLGRRVGLCAPTGARVIDHLLARGLASSSRARQWPAERREVADPTARAGDRPLTDPTL